MLKHYLALTLPGDPAGVIAATGEPASPPYGLTDSAAAWLPHSCDEWVIGEGPSPEVIAALQQLRDEIDAAITRLQARP
ncbi:hypothetical protein [Kitasatospora indigofera]|uniref:hypothetical protein n=1 Tax=Kitasatospora indigofera TaxID=67307 RepID=UPI0036CE2CCD